jgi:site-specific DNA-adenine methylase
MIEIFIGVAAVLVAVWQLNLQRQEIRRNGKINTLVHLSTIIKDRIDLYRTIIVARKQKNQPWQGHAKVINDELRPLLDKINKELIDITSEYKCSFKHSDVERALKLQNEINDID